MEFGTLATAFAQNVQSIEAPEVFDDSLTNGPIEVPPAPSKKFGD